MFCLSMSVQSRLFLILHAFNNRMVSSTALLTVTEVIASMLTECCSDLFSLAAAAPDILYAVHL